MPAFVARFGFPLLAKELVELSARRRTYLVRVVYAIALYGVTLWMYWNWLRQFEPDSFEILGQGGTLFRELIGWQFWGIYLFLPVATSSAITSEKERDTLSLLLLTKLSSWTILFEKLLSRLVAMGSYLFLGLPLTAVAYSLGGVDVDSILKAAYVLMITSLQVASFALLCSTWFRTTSAAFVGTYLLGTVGVLFGSELLKLILGAGIMLGAHKLPWPGLTEEGREWFVTSVHHNPSYRPLYGPWLLQSDPLGSERAARLLGLLPEANHWVEIYNSGWTVSYDSNTGLVTSRPATGTRNVAIPLYIYPTTPGPFSGSTDRTTLHECVACSLPLLGSALAFLILARVFLWRRMRVPETSLLTRLFVLGDHCFQTLNQNPVTRGMVISSARDDLPVEKPIAWRETRKRSFGTTRHLVRLLLLLEASLLAWVAWRLWTWHGAGSLTLASGALPSLWTLAVLIVTVQSTGLITVERSRQTLDVLLTTPLTSREIALQKLAGLHRLMLVLAVPLLTISMAESAWTAHSVGLIHESIEIQSLGRSRVSGRIRNSFGQTESQFEAELPAYVDSSMTSNPTTIAAITLFGRILGVFIYLPLLGWIGFQLGLRLRTQTQAIWITLAAVGVICLVPELMVRLIEAAHVWLDPPSQLEVATFEIEREMGVASQTRPAWLLCLVWLSPLRNVFQESFPRDSAQQPLTIWMLVLFHFGIFIGTLCCLRRNALKHFSRLVHRTEAVVARTN